MISLILSLRKAEDKINRMNLNPLASTPSYQNMVIGFISCMHMDKHLINNPFQQVTSCRSVIKPVGVSHVLKIKYHNLERLISRSANGGGEWRRQRRETTTREDPVRPDRINWVPPISQLQTLPWNVKCCYIIFKIFVDIFSLLCI